ncbi:hypothetical protein [Streptomyces litchfieldiae]|uniref:Vegetative cell wall protein gp1 n=1 Tax=Streptomyces litchfieldiae TaxID=3075543 RepID=A0ABU2MLR0_9ACTN|nr:hypothetical protein [Streptomyces sp. DSM 44938]MDT0342551.1 hypothetical protein [Streptomyces sp. DSM 44938]
MTTGLLSELGRRIAERWVALLVLPGLVFTATAAAAFSLGHGDWAELDLLRDRLADLGAGSGAGAQPGSVRTALLLTGVVAASAASAFVARALGAPFEALLLGRWPRVLRRPAAALTRRRRAAWRALDERYETARAAGADGHHLGELADDRNRLALAEPRHPTWTGDRMHAPATRVEREYHLDLAAAWPRLWLLLPDSSREPLAAARQRFDEANALGGWAVLYTALGALWWPGALLGLSIGYVARRRARVAADGYAELVEAAVDVHLHELIEHFDDATRPVRPQAGARVTERFRKAT